MLRIGGGPGGEGGRGSGEAGRAAGDAGDEGGGAKAAESAGGDAGGNAGGAAAGDERGAKAAESAGGAAAGEAAAGANTGKSAGGAAAGGVAAAGRGWSSSSLSPALEAAAKGKHWDVLQQLLTVMLCRGPAWDPVSLHPTLVSLVTHPQQLVTFLEAVGATGLQWTGEALAPVLLAAAREGAVQLMQALLLLPGVGWRGVDMAAAAVALMSGTTAEGFAATAEAPTCLSEGIPSGSGPRISARHVLEQMIEMPGAGWREEELAGMLWRAAEFGDGGLLQQLLMVPGVGWSKEGVEVAAEFARRKGLLKELQMMMMFS